MADLGGLEQGAHFGQLFDDLGVGFKDVETGEKFHGRQEAARIVQGRVDVQLVVLAAVVGSGVDAAGTGIQGHVAAQDQGGLAVIEGMTGDEAFQFLTGGAAHHGHVFPAEGLGAAFQQLFGQQVLATAGLHQHVGEFGVQADGHVVRQGPGRGGPDDHIGAGRIGAGDALGQGGIVEGEAHEDGGRGMVAVFHFGFGQGRMAGAAPVDGLLGAHHTALVHELGQFVGRGGLIGGVHALVGIVPVAQHAQALELLAAHLAHHVGGQGLFLFLQFLFHLVLDGQAVAVPAGHIVGAIALHVARLDHDILQDLVQGRAHVDMTVGIRRAVMQDERTLVGAVLDHGFTGFGFFPLLELLGLALGKIGLHGEGGLGQIQGFFIVAHAGSSGNVKSA